MICPLTLLVIERQRLTESIQSGCRCWLSRILQVQRVWVAQILLPLNWTQHCVTNVLDTCVEPLSDAKDTDSGCVAIWSLISQEYKRLTQKCKLGCWISQTAHCSSHRRHKSCCEWTVTRKLNDSLRADRLCHAASIHSTKSALQIEPKLVLTVWVYGLGHQHNIIPDYPSQTGDRV